MKKLLDTAEVKIDKTKLNRMKIKIYNLERQNYKTHRYTIPEMINKIREIIITEYKRNV